MTTERVWCRVSNKPACPTPLHALPRDTTRGPEARRDAWSGLA
jgi:hypothetical protein